MVDSKRDGAADASVPQASGAAARGAKSAPRYIDAFDVSRRGAVLSGETPLASFARLAEDLPSQDGLAHWTLRGETGPHGQALLCLEVQAAPQVICQRCLEVFAWPLSGEAVLQLVRSEAELEVDDAQADAALQDEYDKVLGTGRFDVLAQVEDEIILELPYIARHDVCPSGPLTKEAGEEAVEEEKPHPFAGLAGLKGKLKPE
ncbi:DUF177 domain-containing protein [Verticiella sediminum]|uniref:Large ribosomal RNA subunit accumulation protein YceD n=1 Tax=Verticiella sediminum TaxID=1247510 RepID=A0A556AS57_9BURK|nr:YceD family protein [Verticiella sediminum]TSH95750.1 DUF177 domain-containing protein [Verticiella sediminum]